MAVPLIRKYNHASTAVGTFVLSTDALTGLTVQQLNRSNIILDMVSSIQPTGNELYEVKVLVNGLEAGVTFWRKATRVEHSTNRNRRRTGCIQLFTKVCQFVLGGVIAISYSRLCSNHKTERCYIRKFSNR